MCLIQQDPLACPQRRNQVGRQILAQVGMLIPTGPPLLLVFWRETHHGDGGQRPCLWLDRRYADVLTFKDTAGQCCQALCYRREGRIYRLMVFEDDVGRAKVVLRAD